MTIIKLDLGILRFLNLFLILLRRNEWRYFYFLILFENLNNLSQQVCLLVLKLKYLSHKGYGKF